MVADSRTPLRADRLRALNLPRPIEVRSEDARPTAIREGGAAWVPVEAVLDTWRIDDEWWRRPIARCYVEILLAGGIRAVLFQDLVSGAWFAQQP